MVDYLFVSHFLAIQQARHQMRQSVSSFEEQLRHTWKPGQSRIDLLSADLARTGEKPLWITIRTFDDTPVESVGPVPLHTFALNDVIAGLRTHDPVFRDLKTSSGEAVAEVFALYVPYPNTASPPPKPDDAHPPFLVLELAMPLTPADPSILKIHRRNLFIACAGALALLVTVIIASLSVRSLVRGRLLEQQLEIAREVQTRLLPSPEGTFPSIRIAAAYQPAEQVSGDFYDFFRVDGKIALIIGDVSGKGVPAALLMGVLHGAIRTSPWAQSAALHEGESAQVNRLLCQNASGERYATMFWSWFDPATRLLHYINAGHTAPLLLSGRDGTASWSSLGSGGPVIGILADAVYIQATCPIHPGDLLILCSDGLLEATRSDGEEFGEARLRSLVSDVPTPDPDLIKQAILENVHTFLGPTPPHDDLTVLIASFT